MTTTTSRYSFISGYRHFFGQCLIDRIQIDVFFNAVLANSTIVPSRYRNDQNSMTEHVVRFAGHRVARMLEKPWIFNPPSQFSDYVKAASHASRDAGQRWKAVSSALLKEADDLGRNSQGDRPAIGEYLESLASQPMPCNSAGMSSSLKHNFGIIDIVITYGRGAKLGPDTPYLTEPTPLKLLGFGPSSSPDEDRLGSFTRKKDVGSRHSLIEPPRTRTNDATTRSSRVFRSVSALQPKIPPPTPSGEPRKISHLMTFVGDGNSRVKRQAFEALKDGDLDSLLKQPPEEAWRGIATDSGAAVTPHSPHLEPTLPSRPTPPTNKVNGPSPNSQAAAAALLELSTLQTANSHSGRSTVPANSHTSPCVPQTKPSDFKSQNTESTLRPASFTRTSSAGPPEESSTYPHSPQSSALTSPPPELSDDDSTNPAEASKRSSRSGASIWVKLKYTQPLSSHASTISTDISPFKSPKANKATDGPPSTPLQTARPSRSQTPIQTGTFAARQSPVWCSSHLDKGFVPGPLSEGCRIGFAEPGVVRNVGSVRGGWFKEAGVLMGVRFIVG